MKGGGHAGVSPGYFALGEATEDMGDAPTLCRDLPATPHGSALSPSPSKEGLCATGRCWLAPVVAQGDGMVPGVGAGPWVKAGQLISPMSSARLWLHLSV